MAIIQTGSVTWDKIRQVRNQKLAEVDWLVTRHRDQLDSGPKPSLSKEKYTSLLAYRQQLRDITKTFPDPKNIVWPASPA